MSVSNEAFQVTLDSKNAEIVRLRAALQKIADIETRLGVPAGLDMQSIAVAALKPIT